MEMEDVTVVDSSEEDEAPVASPGGSQEEAPKAEESEEEEDTDEDPDLDQSNCMSLLRAVKDPDPDNYAYRGSTMCEAAMEAEEIGDATPFVFGLLKNMDIAKLLVENAEVKNAMIAGQDYNASRIAGKVPSGLLLGHRSFVGYLIQRNAGVDKDLGVSNGKLGGIVYDKLGRAVWHDRMGRSIVVERSKIAGLTKAFQKSSQGAEGLDILRIRRKKGHESGVTRAMYVVEDREGKLVSSMVYMEMTTEGVPKPWSSSSSRHSLQGNVAKRMRVSVRDELNLKMERGKAQATVVGEYYSAKGGAEDVAPDMMVNPQALAEQWKSHRKAANLPRRSKGGRVVNWNEAEVRQALNSQHEFALESQFESRPEHKIGWRLAFTCQEALDRLEQCCVVGHPNFKRKQQSYVLVDTTFEKGFSVHLLAFSDKLFSTKNNKPTVSLAFVFLSERRLEQDFEWIALQVRNALQRRLGKGQNVNDMALRAIVRDSDAAQSQGLDAVPLFRNAIKCYCSLHLTSNITESLEKAAGGILKPFTFTLIGHLFGREQGDGEGGRWRENGFCDYSPADMPRAWESLRDQLLREVQSEEFGEEGQAEERYMALDQWLDDVFVGRYLPKFITGYNIQTRQPFYDPNEIVGRVTNNALEAKNPLIHRRLTGMISVAEAIPKLCQVFVEEREAKKAAMLGVGGGGSFGLSVAPAFRLEYEMDPTEFYRVRKDKRLNFIRKAMPSVKKAPNLDEEQEGEKEGPRLRVLAEELGVPLLHAEACSKLNLEAAELLKGTYNQIDQETIVMKGKDNRIYSVQLIPFACTTNGCRFWQTTQHCLCPHVLVAIHHSLETQQLFESYLENRVGHQEDTIRSGTMFQKAGRKKGEHFKGVGRKPNSPVRPLTAVLENAAQAENRLAVQFADKRGLFTPNAGQLSLLRKPRPEHWNPQRFHFHTGNFFYVHTFKSATASGVRKMDTRKCPSCHRLLSDPTLDPPGDLLILHEEKWVEPTGKADKNASFHFPDAPPASMLAAGKHWEAREDAMLASNNGRDFKWSRNAGNRTYHCRYNCLVGRHEYVEASLIKLAPTADFTRVHLAWLKLQFNIDI